MNKIRQPVIKQIVKGNTLEWFQSDETPISSVPSIDRSPFSLCIRILSFGEAIWSRNDYTHALSLPLKRRDSKKRDRERGETRECSNR